MRKIRINQLTVILKVIFGNFIILMMIVFFGSVDLVKAERALLIKQILIYISLAFALLIFFSVYTKRAYIYYLFLAIFFLGAIVLLIELLILNFEEVKIYEIVLYGLLLSTSLIHYYFNRRQRLVINRKLNYGQGNIHPENGLWDISKRIIFTKESSEERASMSIEVIGRFISPFIPALGFFLVRTYGSSIISPYNFLFLTYFLYVVGLFFVTHLVILVELIILEKINGHQINLCSNKALG